MVCHTNTCFYSVSRCQKRQHYLVLCSLTIFTINTYACLCRHTQLYMFVQLLYDTREYSGLREIHYHMPRFRAKHRTVPFSRETTTRPLLSMARPQETAGDGNPPDQSRLPSFRFKAIIFDVSATTTAFLHTATATL